MIKKRIITALMILLPLMTFAGTPEWMFVETASVGKMKHVEGQIYELTLKQEKPTLTAFGDRPIRKINNIGLTVFQQLWSTQGGPDNFAKTPPNAAISMKFAEGREQNHILVLHKPKVQGLTVTYRVKILDKTPVMTGNMTDIVMVVDPIHWCPVGFQSC